MQKSTNAPDEQPRFESFHQKCSQDGRIEMNDEKAAHEQMTQRGVPLSEQKLLLEKSRQIPSMPEEERLKYGLWGLIGRWLVDLYKEQPGTTAAQVLKDLNLDGHRVAFVSIRGNLLPDWSLLQPVKFDRGCEIRASNVTFTAEECVVQCLTGLPYSFDLEEIPNVSKRVDFNIPVEHFQKSVSAGYAALALAKVPHFGVIVRFEGTVPSSAGKERVTRYYSTHMRLPYEFRESLGSVISREKILD